MKRYFYYGLLLVSLFVISFEAKAQCPDGYDQTTVEIDVGSCTYDVVICYKCEDEMGTTTSDILVYRWTIQDNCVQAPPMNTNEVYEGIWEEVTQPAFLNNLCGLAGPCDVSPGGFWFTVSVDQCFIKIKAGDRIWYSPCWEGNTPCVIVYRICWDPSLPGFKKIIEQDWTDYSTYSCPSTEPPDPVNNGDETTCFGLSSPCNPIP